MNNNNVNIDASTFNTYKIFLKDIESLDKWLYLYIIYPTFAQCVQHECLVLKLLFNSINSNILNIVNANTMCGTLVRDRVFGNNQDNEYSHILSRDAAQWLLKHEVC